MWKNGSASSPPGLGTTDTSDFTNDCAGLAFFFRLVLANDHRLFLYYWNKHI